MSQTQFPKCFSFSTDKENRRFDGKRVMDARKSQEPRQDGNNFSNRGPRNNRGDGQVCVVCGKSCFVVKFCLEFVLLLLLLLL
jgi:hypothetical protein